ncbi:MAG: single-stranded DNA-binding protein [Candidatus Gracilibacteria bacterium]|jgi:single-strand DNA-binding protein
MRSVNKVVLMGHLAADPEAKVTQKGQNLARFRVAIHRDWQGSDGEHHEATDFHKIVAWRKLGEVCALYLKKGSPVYLEGKIMNHHYEGKDGKDHLTTEIVADVVNFISYKKNKEGGEIQLQEVSTEA